MRKDFCKVFTGTYLFEDDCEVGSHGPVYRVIFNKYKSISVRQS